MTVVKKGKWWVELDGKGKEVRRSRTRIEEKPKAKKKVSTKVEEKEEGEQ